MLSLHWNVRIQSLAQQSSPRMFGDNPNYWVFSVWYYAVQLAAMDVQGKSNIRHKDFRSSVCPMYICHSQSLIWIHRAHSDSHHKAYWYKSFVVLKCDIITCIWPNHLNLFLALQIYSKIFKYIWKCLCNFFLLFLIGFLDISYKVLYGNTFAVDQ